MLDDFRHFREIFRVEVQPVLHNALRQYFCKDEAMRNTDVFDILINKWLKSGNVIINHVNHGIESGLLAFFFMARVIQTVQR
jgi:hypothetical protein